MRETLLCTSDNTDLEVMKAVCIKIIRNRHSLCPGISNSEHILPRCLKFRHSLMTK